MVRVKDSDTLAKQSCQSGTWKWKAHKVVFVQLNASRLVKSRMPIDMDKQRDHRSDGKKSSHGDCCKVKRSWALLLRECLVGLCWGRMHMGAVARWDTHGGCWKGNDLGGACQCGVPKWALAMRSGLPVGVWSGLPVEAVDNWQTPKVTRNIQCLFWCCVVLDPR